MITVSTASCLALFLIKARLSATSSQAPAPQPVSTTSASNVVTAAPEFSCVNQDQDPGLGILSAFCICDDTISLPQITPTPDLQFNTLPCAYKSRPACQNCSSMGMLEGGCSPITNCNSHVKASVSSIRTQKKSLSKSSTSTQKKSSSTALAPKETTAAEPFTTLMRNIVSKSSSSSMSSCLLQDQYCFLQGSGHAFDGLREDCILWNSSCSGNKSLAASRFWPGAINTLMRNKCFFDPSPACTMSNPPGRMSAFADAKSWMRSPECFSAQLKRFFGDDDQQAAENRESAFLNETCCGDCDFVADNIDVYFWPDAHADLSCQSIIGDGVSDVAHGATSDGSILYWGCTSFGPGTSSILTTATLTTIANITFRDYIFNPWQESPCEIMSASPQSNTTAYLQQRNIEHPLRPRAHTLIATNGKISTVVQGQYTFTFPSVYIGFSGLNAGDKCGSTSFSSTMLAFSPGELSTIVGPVDRRFSSSRKFDPGDLPCPPQSIMSENWYTPLPGVPYRPFFAFPERLRQIAPAYKHCDAFWFHAFDPPHFLVPASALAGPTTKNEPTTPSVGSKPSPIPDSGVRQTAIDADPTNFATYATQAASPHFAPLPQQSGTTPKKDPQNNVADDPAAWPIAGPAPLAPDQGLQQSPPPRDGTQDPTGYPLQNPLTQERQYYQDNGQPSWTDSAPADPPSPASLPPAVLTVGGTTFTPNPTAFPIAGTTISAGGSRTVVGGTSISLNPSGSLIVGGTRTTPLQIPTPFSVFTIGGNAFTLQPGGLVAVDGHTLRSGDSGTTIAGGLSVSVGSGSIVVGSQTISLPVATASLYSGSAPAYEGVAATLNSAVALWLMIGGCWLLVFAILYI